MGQVSTRTVVSVDLGDLTQRVTDAATLAGIGRSTWLKDIARRELAAAHPSAPLALRGEDEESRAVYRAWFSAARTAKLDCVVAANGLRSRIAALTALVDGIVLGDRADSRPLQEAVGALGLSNHHLVGVRQRLAAIAARPGVRPEDSDVIAVAIADIRRHLLVSAALVGDIRPLLKTP